jgi:multisubunit Na+/H+ antiporter MnhC subunit
MSQQATANLFVLTLTLLVLTWAVVKIHRRVSKLEQSQDRPKVGVLRSVFRLENFQGLAGGIPGSMRPTPSPQTPPTRYRAEPPATIIGGVIGLVLFIVYAAVVGFALTVLALVGCFLVYRLSCRNLDRKYFSRPKRTLQPGAGRKLGFLLMGWTLSIFLFIEGLSLHSHTYADPIAVRLMQGLIVGGLGTFILPFVIVFTYCKNSDFGQ